MARTLFILNDGPYGTERSYNGLRVAGSVAKRDGEVVKIFLIGDAAGCAHSGQKVPKGYYNVEVMLRSVIRHGGLVGVCGSCMMRVALTRAGWPRGAIGVPWKNSPIGHRRPTTSWSSDPPLKRTDRKKHNE